MDKPIFLLLCHPMNRLPVLTKFEVTLVLGAYIVAGQIWGGRTATILLVLAGVGYFVANELIARNAKHNKLREQQARNLQIRDSVVRHKRVLLRKHRQGCFTDEYGMLNDKKWQSDLRHFIDNVLPMEVDYMDDEEDFDLQEFVQEILDGLQESMDAENLEDPPLPALQSTHSLGMQFEHKCAQVLRSVGWNARVTVASGDQGVDIEAERQDGYRIVVQCKYYSSPVGNSAVQEIAAGVQHYQANRGVVVSQASFTPAARRLAKTTNVLLVDLDDLKYIDSLLDGLEVEEMFDIEQSEAVERCKNARLEINPEFVQYSASPRSPADSGLSRIGTRFKRAQRHRIKSGLSDDEN